ncbi:LLM class flavin-dependent oxidoreductase [Amycolatopsis sp. La24]|uniref:LLM class flavin-dependent oxidoreductase n=1 Tax=Amycolatopsis sp. La24 TaxID=3028304 RepID=UPI0031B62CF8
MSEDPFSFGHSVSTMDNLSEGRIGWNIVTSVSHNAAQNYGLDEIVARDKRYEWVDEYMDVATNRGRNPGMTASASRTGRVFEDANSGKKAKVSDVAGALSNNLKIVGTPETIEDQLEQWQDAGIDGVNMIAQRFPVPAGTSSSRSSRYCRSEAWPQAAHVPRHRWPDSRPPPGGRPPWRVRRLRRGQQHQRNRRELAVTNWCLLSGESRHRARSPVAGAAARSLHRPLAIEVRNSSAQIVRIRAVPARTTGC